jgi:hypothetical protein
MKIENMFISDSIEFSKQNKFINQIFNTKMFFPDQIFRKGYGNFIFGEFDRTLSEKFWDTLQHLVYLSGDKSILIAVFEPHPQFYYHKEFGSYNWIKIPVELKKDDYWQILEFGPIESPMDCILYTANKIAWTVPSMKWGIWGERDLGIYVFGSMSDFHFVNDSKSETWEHIEYAINNWVSPNFKDKNALDRFHMRIVANYS